MDAYNLVRMANRIADFFKAMPDCEQAQRDAIEHLRKFWEPRMRQDLLDHLASVKNHGLDPFMVQALGKHPML